MKNVWLPILLVAILAVLILFKPYYGWEIRKFFTLNPAPSGSIAADLAAENENLKAELAKLENIKSQFPERTPGFIGALVYSRYPFNFKNEFLLNVGAKDGVLAGRAVLLEGVLIGKVSKVFDMTALAQTVFDGDFQAAVRVGAVGVQALLRGGVMPRLTLIPLTARVSAGDIVYSASPDFPYGLPVGEVGTISTSSDKLFREATVNFVYDINSVSAVLIVK